MNPILRHLLVERAKSRLKKRTGQEEIPKKLLVKEVRSRQVELAHLLKEVLFMAIGVFAAGFGLKGFLLPQLFYRWRCYGSIIINKGYFRYPTRPFVDCG